MSYQLSDLITRVQQRIKDTGYSTSEITNYLNDAQRDIFNEYRLPFTQTTQTYTLNTASSDITNGSGLPADFDQAINLTLTTSGRETVIPYMDYKEVQQNYPDPDDTTAHPANSPILWYKFGTVVRVFPMPSEAFTVSLKYVKKPTALTNASDVPEVPSNFEEILVLGAAYRVLQVKDNYDQAAILENKCTELLDKMVSRYSQSQVGRPTLMRINRYGVGQKI